MVIKDSLISLIAVFFVASICFAQNSKENINLNPDPEGSPWFIDGYQESVNKVFISKEKIEKISNTLLMKKDALPVRIDHSFSTYMRPVFSQDGGSCGSASRICYMFGYEINNYRNADASLRENIFPSHFTWMLTGQNSSKEQMAIFNGVPNSIDYGGDTYSKIFGKSGIGWPTDESDYGWMDGFDRWRNAMDNRLESNSFLSLSTPENLEILKSWMHDHHGDATFNEGGVAGAGVAIGNVTIVKIPSGLHEAGKDIVKKWGSQVDHGTTWSGYDDNIEYDFNGDGEITNDIDINNDGKVDMADWERGALIMLNSWGSSWGNSGTVYVPYRLLKINNMEAEFYHIRKDYSPKLVMKIKMTFSNRSAMNIRIGIAPSHDAESPERKVFCHHFINAGNGDVPMLGRWADGIMHEEAMEFGLDLTDVVKGYDLSQPYKLFFIVKPNIKEFTYGKIEALSVLDYTESLQGEEIVAEISRPVIIADGLYHNYSINMLGTSGTKPEYTFISQSGMTIKYCDSEETVGEDGAVANAIDGDPTTIWHTEWSSSTPSLPHELQIDLNDKYLVGQVQYLPRQDGGVNGRIADYEVYVSLDGDNWGESVATGTFENSSSEQSVIFPEKEGRYVRLVALSEVNGKDYTSIAELNILQKSTTTLIADDESTPLNYKLLQNYPNPFNPSTSIRFDLPIESKVRLKVFDILGNLVKVLADNEFPAGKYQVNWDGTNLNGENVVSGLYFYSLSSDAFNKSKKMILLK